MATHYDVDDQFIREFENWLRFRAKKMKDNAGFNGDHHDGGASSLNIAWDCYVAGYKHNDFPYSGSAGRYLDDYLKETDPEYDEYIRLKTKFEK